MFKCKNNKRNKIDFYEKLYTRTKENLHLLNIFMAKKIAGRNCGNYIQNWEILISHKKPNQFLQERFLRKWIFIYFPDKENWLLLITWIWNHYSELRNSSKKLNRFLQIIFFSKANFYWLLFLPKEIKACYILTVGENEKILINRISKGVDNHYRIEESENFSTFNVCGRIGAIC